MKRSVELDGVRGVAILLVLLWHYVFDLLGAEPQTAAAYLRAALRLTWSGVDLFFVLSGFLIAGILLDNRTSSNYFGVFYIRRVCRIFPVYFLSLAVFLCLSTLEFAAAPSFAWLFSDPFPAWSYATFTQNILMGLKGTLGPNWLAVTWSLAVEEQFYLLVPLLIYFLPRRALLGVLIAAVIAAPILRFAFPGPHAFVNVPWRADSLLSGAALAVLVRSPGFVSTIQAHRTAVSILFVVFVAGLAFMTLRPEVGAFGNAFSHSWLAGTYTVFVLIAYLNCIPVLTKTLRFPVLVWFGQLSYGIYLIHQPVMGLIRGTLQSYQVPMGALSVFAMGAAAFGVTLLAASLSFRLMERPALQFGHRFRYQD